MTVVELGLKGKWKVQSLTLHFVPEAKLSRKSNYRLITFDHYSQPLCKHKDHRGSEGFKVAVFICWQHACKADFFLISNVNIHSSFHQI